MVDRRRLGSKAPCLWPLLKRPGFGRRDSGFVKAGNTASTNPESRLPNPGFIESTVGSSGRSRAGAGNTSDFPLAILPRPGVAGSAWAADARPADAPHGLSPHAAPPPHREAVQSGQKG